MAWFCFSRSRHYPGPLQIGSACLLICLPAVQAQILPADTHEFVPELPLWDKTFNLRAGTGYKDNLLLSNTMKEKSILFDSGLDFTLLRLPLDGKQFYFFLSGEDVRYPQGKLIDHEQYLIGLAQFKMDLTPAWIGSIDLNYL